jgi:cellulose synthase/poly-beta-1,6-N-acetylglucosamine synthase-like glycosyltransferase
VTPPQLSVIIPVYNERYTVRELVRRVVASDVSKEIVVVDAARRMARWTFSGRWRIATRKCGFFSSRAIRGRGP